MGNSQQNDCNKNVNSSNTTCAITKYPCECGATLQLRVAGGTYNEYSSVICDVCNKTLPDTTAIYHCPSKYADVHPKGWDVCEYCIAKSKHEYYAIVIQAPLLSNKSVNCSKDGIIFSQFLRDELKYDPNHIQLIASDHVNIKDITTAIHSLKGKLKIGDVVIVLFSGHGAMISGQYHFELSNKQLWQSNKLQEMILQNLSNYNVLFLINACYSGAFGKEIESNVKLECIVCRQEDNKGYQFACGHFCCGGCCRGCPHLQSKSARKCPICKPKDVTAQSIFSNMNQKSKQNLMAITSCNQTQESNFWYPMSPFVEYTIEALKNGMNTPIKLMHYVQQQYSKPKNEINISLLSLDQGLYSVSYGNTDFFLSSTC
eukprot:227858_1